MDNNYKSPSKVSASSVNIRYIKTNFIHIKGSYFKDRETRYREISTPSLSQTLTWINC